MVSVYRRAPAVAETAIDQDLFLVAPETQEIVHLDRMAAAVWRLLEAPRTAADIAAAFAAAFPDEAGGRIAGDIAVVLLHLREYGVVLAD